MQKDNILISVVIPVKNGDIWLDACLKSIMSQTLFDRTEIIAIDSGSTDKSIEIMEKYPVKIVSTPPKEFNHGLTRNYGVQFCNGEYIVMTVQDARAIDKYWLQNLLDGFTAAENVGGVCGQQVVPHEKEANPVGWFRPVSAPGKTIFSFKSANEYDALPALEKKNCCGWDNVTAMYKKEVLEKVPFQKMVYGEDAVWAQDALRAGYAIVYNNAARVFHYHTEDEDYAFKRTFTTMYLRYKTFGYLYPEPKLSFRQTLSIIKTLWKTKSITLQEKLKWFRYNINQEKAIKKAHKEFMEALSVSESMLDNVHQKYCGTAPVPLKQTEYEPAIS